MNRDEQIQKIESKVEASESIPAEKKAELLGLLAKLKPAIASASEIHQDHAEKILNLVDASVHEAAQGRKKPDAIGNLTLELEGAVQHFEASHPDLVAFVTEYTAFLSALGI